MDNENDTSGKNVTSGAQPVRQVPKANGRKSTVQQSAERTSSFIESHKSQLKSNKARWGGITARPSSDESIEAVSDLDWEKESSNRYELASPKSRALQLWVK